MTLIDGEKVLDLLKMKLGANHFGAKELISATIVKIHSDIEELIKQCEKDAEFALAHQTLSSVKRKIPFKAEIIHETAAYNASRYKVIGGWIFSEWLRIGDIDSRFTTTFIPDPNHEWEL